MTLIVTYPSSDFTGHSYTSSGLTANLICRVLFAFLGSLLCWVPFRQLYRNGEFAAAIFVVDVVILNMMTIVNSLLWRSDDLSSWWSGIGLCDIEVWIWCSLTTIYAACIFAIMRHTASLVSLSRVAGLTPREKRRERLIEALIIFPIPIFEFAFTWFDIKQRFTVGTLFGCLPAYDTSWPQFVVYSLPATIYMIGTTPYAYLTWKRYRSISKSARIIFPRDSIAAVREQKTRRRLYLMCLSILVPYTPVAFAFLVFNITHNGWLPYDYYRIHKSSDPYPWDSILFVPSWEISWVQMNQPYITILTTIPIVMFFGMTNDAIGTYRRYAIALRLGKLFPCLRLPWNPDQPKVRSRRASEGTWLTLMSRTRRSSVPNKPQAPLPVPRTETPLSNRHHQAVVSASGIPNIPPRRSSTGAPEIPPRSSSLNRVINSRSTGYHLHLPARLPSISSFHSGQSKSSIGAKPIRVALQHVESSTSSRRQSEEKE